MTATGSFSPRFFRSFRRAFISSASRVLALGIGDTLRVTLTADPVKEIYAAKKILLAAGLRQEGPNIIACPTCGRTNIDLIPMAEEVERRLAGCTRAVICTTTSLPVWYTKGKNVSCPAPRFVTFSCARTN